MQGKWESLHAQQHATCLNYKLLPETSSNWSSLLMGILDKWSYCSLASKSEWGCLYGGLQLESNIRCVSTVSGIEYAASMLTRCFFADLTPLGLSSGELLWQPESGVRGSWREENDSSIEILLARAFSFASLSNSGVSEVGAGVAGSVLMSDAGQLSFDAGADNPEPVPSERTPLSRCCSSIIFFKYLPWASMRNCSCLCTCCISNFNTTCW